MQKRLALGEAMQSASGHDLKTECGRRQSMKLSYILCRLQVAPRAAGKQVQAMTALSAMGHLLWHKLTVHFIRGMKYNPELARIYMDMGNVEE